MLRIVTSTLTPPGRSLLYQRHFEEDRYSIADDDDQARGDLEAGQEGHHEHIGKVGGTEEDLNVVPPPEPI